MIKSLSVQKTVSCLAILLMAAWIPLAHAAPYNTNLIVNGNAEAGASSSTGSPVSVPGWTLTNAFTVVPYGSPGGFPLATDPGPPDRAAQFFAGGNDASSDANQDIDVSANGSDINAGLVIYNLSGWLGGYLTDADNAKLTLTFFTSANAAIGTAAIGPVSNTDRTNNTGLFLRQSVGRVPAGTTRVHVDLAMTRATGTFNDGYADSLSLILSLDPVPVSNLATNFFYNILGTANSSLWVAPPTWKVMRNTAPPAAYAGGIDLYAARNEFEPVQVVTRSANPGTRSLGLGAGWNGPSGNVITATLHDVAYGPDLCDAGMPDGLNPLVFGATQPICPGNNQVFWLTVYVPTNAAAGVYSNTITCTLPGVTTNFPIRVHVFNFTLPPAATFGSFVNWGFAGNASDTLAVKQWFYQHRLTPSVVTWPSSMQYNTTWDTASNPNQCSAFYDEGDIVPDFSIRWLANKYVAGAGFNNGVGFPNFIAQEFSGNSQPRPTTLCGQSITGDPRGPDYGTTAYNAAWESYLSALQNYCDPTVPTNNGGNPFGNDYLSKAVYYVMNEPQNTSDYNLAAWLASLSRQAAPRLRLMISEQARPEIYDNPLYPGQGYDIWLAHMPDYSTAIGNSLTRRHDHGEQTWWYSVAGDPPQFISPNQTNVPAIETRIMTWLAWQQRAEGWSDAGNDTPIATYLGSGSFAPTIRSELLREAIEDYEYFILANDGRKAQPFVPNATDPFVSPIAGSLTGYDRDPSKLHWLRIQLGQQISGQGATQPFLPVPDPRPYGSYYLNFQDPAGFPTNTPLVVNGHTWTKVGWQLFNPAATNTGWYVTDTNNLLYAWASASSSNAVQKSYIYDDFNRQVTFVYALANGVYDVEVGMGRPGAVSQALVTVNGTDFFGDRNAYLAQSITNNVSATRRLEVVNGSLVMEVGQQINGDYNFVDYLGITAVSPSSPDGLDDLWQTTYFGSATNALAAPSADPDGDGVSNLVEYYFGTDPTSPNSRPWFSATLPAPGQIQLQWSSASNQLYRVESSGDLKSWNVALDQVLSTSSTTTVTLPMAVSSTQGFYRVAVVVQ